METGKTGNGANKLPIRAPSHGPVVPNVAREIIKSPLIPRLCFTPHYRPSCEARPSLLLGWFGAQVIGLSPLAGVAAPARRKLGGWGGVGHCGEADVKQISA